MTLGKAEGLVATEGTPARYASRDQLIGRFSILLPHIPLGRQNFEGQGTDTLSRRVDEVALLTQGLLAVRSPEDIDDHEVMCATEYTVSWLLMVLQPVTASVKGKYFNAGTGRSDADDFEQIMHMQLITEILPKFDPARASFLKFFGGIARSRVVDRIRKEQLDTRINGKSLNHLFEEPGSDEDKSNLVPVSPDEAHDTAVFYERIRLLVNMLSRVTEEQKQAYIAIALNGSTDAEYAKRTGVPLGTIKSRVRTARQKIIRKMELLGHTDYAADTP